MQGTIDYFGVEGFVAPLCEDEVEIIKFNKQNVFVYVHRVIMKAALVDYAMSNCVPLREWFTTPRDVMLRDIAGYFDNMSSAVRPGIRNVVQSAKTTRGEFVVGFKIDVTKTKLILYSCPRNITAAVTFADVGSLPCRTMIEVAFQGYAYTSVLLLECLSSMVARNVMLLCLEDLAVRMKHKDTEELVCSG